MIGPKALPMGVPVDEFGECRATVSVTRSAQVLGPLRLHSPLDRNSQSSKSTPGRDANAGCSRKKKNASAGRLSNTLRAGLDTQPRARDLCARDLCPFCARGRQHACALALRGKRECSNPAVAPESLVDIYMGISMSTP